MQSPSKRKAFVDLWFVAALALCQCALFIYYRDFRSFDLDGDGMRSIMNRLWWHKTENVTNSWYIYRYWLSESLLDLLVYWAYKIYAQLDWIRTLVFGVANLCSFSCALILLRAGGRRLSGLFVLLTWTIPVTWALSSYVVGVTTINFWLASLSGTLLGAFLLTKNPRYLQVMAATAALDLLHLYPSSVLYNGSIALAVGVSVALLPADERRRGVLQVLQALLIAAGTYLIGALVFGYMIAADWLGYFKVFPFFFRFYFVTRAQETSSVLPPGHIFDEIRWLLFSGEHRLPGNDECEQPMFVPQLGLLPGFLVLVGLGLLGWQWLRTKRMPPQTLLLIPLGVFLLALRHTATSQRHYMALIFTVLVFLAATFSMAWTACKDYKNSRMAKAIAVVVLALSTVPIFIKQRAVAAQPFGMERLDVEFGRQAGFARMMGDMQTYIDTWPGPFLLLIADNFRVEPRLLSAEFIVGIQPQERLLQSMVWADKDWQPEALARSGVTKVVVLAHADDLAKRRDFLAQAGYVIDYELAQFKKVAIFARRQ